MKEPLNLEPKIFASCSRCKNIIQLKSYLKSQGCLCNDCFMRWTEIRDKMISKGVYQDEIDKHFIKFVTEPPFLKKFNI